MPQAPAADHLSEKLEFLLRSRLGLVFTGKERLGDSRVNVQQVVNTSSARSLRDARSETSDRRWVLFYHLNYHLNGKSRLLAHFVDNGLSTIW